jgi:hypothetical protein
MHWTYDDLRALPVEVYDVLSEQLIAEHEAREAAREAAE